MPHVSHINVEESKEKVLAKQSQRKYHLPVIGHFANKSIEFKNIINVSDSKYQILKID